MDLEQARKKRKLRKEYLDFKRGKTMQNNIFAEDFTMDYKEFARERRKYRKQVLDDKRSIGFTRSSILTSQSLSDVTNRQGYRNIANQLNHQRTSHNMVIGKENSRPSIHYDNKDRKRLSNQTNLTEITTVTTISNGIYQSHTNREPISNITQQSTSSNATKFPYPPTIICSPTCIKLSSGKHRLKSKSTNIHMNSTFDLGIIEPTNDGTIEVDCMVGISKEYLDNGDQTVKCGMCGAKLWRPESLRSKKRPDKSFSFCCSYGKVELPDFKEAPPSYKQLFCSSDSRSKFFIENIRRYNSMYAFTSMGGKVDRSINKGKGPYVFRLSGENYHRLGSLIPTNGEKPKFSQLYIYDTENEITNRQKLFSNEQKASLNDQAAKFDIELIKFLKGMLDENNALVKSYRMVRDCFHANPEAEVKLKLIGQRSKDGRMYNLPTTSEVAALIVGDFTESLKDRDIMVATSQGYLQRINELHPSYLALQYPLLFPYGDDGYHVKILHRGVTESSKTKRPTCTMREFFAFRAQDRDGNYSLIHNSKRLFQQFLVDAYTMIESERIAYIRSQQKNLRCATYETLRKQKNKGKKKTTNIGTKMILPSSFTGGQRYMQQNYLDAMSLCKWFGYPDFFITFTCNPKWPEIRRFLKDTNLKAEDRPDILCRLFKMKLDALIKDLKDKQIFGKVRAVVYTIEFQKRGLPHSHICLFMHRDYKIRTMDKIDPYISAEIPSENEDPELYLLVKEFMIHGPCGAENPKSPCMADNKCTKNFPKTFSDRNTIDKEGFPVYKRPDNGSFVEKSSDVKLDNRYVVPYNKELLKKYQAHINVEWCNQAGSIKYLFKYINKGPDRATVAVVRSTKDGEEEVVVDEIKRYYDCRYVSACEASWRIFGFDVHYRSPSVIRLPFHLPNKQNVVYGADEMLDDVIDKQSVASSMFLEWMNCNQIYPNARKLTYVEFPTEFVWKPDSKTWEPRHQGFSIGRIHDVDPKVGEGYYLRVLLNKVKGPKSFEEIRTVNGKLYADFRDACYAMGLLDDDKEWIEAIKEASFTGSGHYVRELFGTMLMSGSFSRPEVVWETTWEYLADGILYNLRRTNPDVSLTDDQVKNLTLFEIESFLVENNSTLKDYYKMPYPDDESVSSAKNRLINEELSYDNTQLQSEFHSMISTLTDEQHGVFERIMKAIELKQGGSFFVYGYGGTGKTFLWKALSTALRCKGEIVLNVASSGIASLLLIGGRTAHSRFHIPLNLNENSICFIQPDSPVSKLLKKTSLIIWDEAPMVHRHAFEALDRTLRDVLKCEGAINSELPFGGKVIVFGGDFRQILPVIKRGTRQDTVNASLSSSYLWTELQVLELTKNMRLTVGSDEANVEQTRIFAKWLLDVGEGNVGGSNDGEAVIEIPEDLLITQPLDPIGSLIQFVYPSLLENKDNINYFQERAILAPKNDVVHEINDRLLALFPGEEKVYLSSDNLCKIEELQADFDKNLYSPDVLNCLKISGLPNHKLVLKVGIPVMLLRNTDQKHGLCNGTRLQIVRLGKHVIEAIVLTGSNIGYRTLISRLSLVPSDNKVAFKFSRRQFPLSVCFAMTINKSQGQSLSRVGLYLKKSVFTHGQLYVALSRVKSRDGLKMLILDDDGKPTNKTCNVVYKEVFDSLFQ